MVRFYEAFEKRAYIIFVLGTAKAFRIYLGFMQHILISTACRHWLNIFFTAGIYYGFLECRANTQRREPMPPRRSGRTRTTPKPIYPPATRANQALEPAAMSQDVQGTRQSSETGSGTTADQRPASPPASMPADKADAVLQQLASIASTQKQILGKVGNNGAKIDRNYNELKQYFATEIKQVRDDVFPIHGKRTSCPTRSPASVQSGPADPTCYCWNSGSSIRVTPAPPI